MASLKKMLRRFLPFPKRKTLRRWFPSFETRNLVRLLGRYDIDFVVDVGANRGQFVEKLRSAGWSGPIVSFEPLAAEHALITARAARDPAWRIAPRMALGRTQGTMALNVLHDSSLSSFLAPASGPGLKAEAAAREAVEAVPVHRLDEVLPPYLDGARNLLLKVDVQGFEPEVFAGAPETLARAAALFVELAILPSYAGETPYLEMLDWLRRLGFHAVSFAPVLSRRRYGETWQMDALLVRRPPALHDRPRFPLP